MEVLVALSRSSPVFGQMGWLPSLGKYMVAKKPS